ncbi:MAG: helix-turn-helix domain-containing protein [Coriobacteriales bacterium]|nr:helix-turn-helix domain-containing protein [Coriobacteriales bacterium]
MAQAIERLLRQYVDSAGRVEEYDVRDALSPFLSGSFSIYRAEVLGREVFFAERTDGTDDYGALGRRLDQLTKGLGIPHGERVVLYADSLPPNVRRSFLESGTPFATADGDIYVPFLSFRINASRQRLLPTLRRFRSSDQSVFLFGLYAEEGFAQEDVMRGTGLSVGSVSRALANLVAARVIDFEVAGKTGRKKTYFRTDDHAYYQAGVELFGDAVRTTALTNALPRDAMPLVSGLCALAQTSDLLAPDREVWAISPSHASSVVLTEPDPARGFRHAIQILNYDPTPFAQGNRVDPFTMLVTIPSADRSDERVRIALREALGGCAWYRD